MDRRKNIRFKLRSLTILTVLLGVVGTIFTLTSPMYGVQVSFGFATLIGLIMCVNQILLYIELLERLNFNEGLKAFRNTLKNE